jgi:glutamyl-tRNA synthetase
MGLVNVEVTKTGKMAEAKFQSKEHKVARERGALFIHWLMKDNSVEAEVVMPDASVSKGRAEKLAAELDIDAMLQFERFGFVRVDSKEPLRFYYAHN